MRIIGLCGFKGSGKSFTANRIKAELETKIFGVKIISFADGLREMTYKLMGTDLNAQEYSEFKEKDFKMELSGKTISFTGRELLQKLGTDVLRKINDNIWIDIMKEKVLSIKNDKSADVIIIDDIRFENELEFVKSLRSNDVGIKVIFSSSSLLALYYNILILKSSFL